MTTTSTKAATYIYTTTNFRTIVQLRLVQIENLTRLHGMEGLEIAMGLHSISR